MPLQTFQITADVPSDLEPTGEFRVAEIGAEPFITDKGGIETVRDGGGIGVRTSGPRIILRPVWQWPEFIQGGWWLSHNVCGDWFLSEHAPRPNSVSWEFGCRAIGLTHDIIRAFNLTLPPLSEDWRQSLRQKPL